MGRKQEYPDNLIRQWYAEYQAGLTTWDIEAKYGISRSHFARRCRLLGLKVKRWGRPSPYMARNRDIVAAINHGVAPKELALKYHLSRQRVYQIYQFYSEKLGV